MAIFLDDRTLDGGEIERRQETAIVDNEARLYFAEPRSLAADDLAVDAPVVESVTYGL